MVLILKIIQGRQEAVFNIVDENNIATAHLPKEWKRSDELYNFKWIGTDLKILISIDESSYTGGGNGDLSSYGLVS
jgi:hypothetical protein